MTTTASPAEARKARRDAARATWADAPTFGPDETIAAADFRDGDFLVRFPTQSVGGRTIRGMRFDRIAYRGARVARPGFVHISDSRRTDRHQGTSAWAIPESGRLVVRRALAPVAIPAQPTPAQVGSEDAMWAATAALIARVAR